MEWISVKNQLPPQGKIVNTKIDDELGERNEQELILSGRLWWTDDMKMYVYYTPTHWKETK